MTKPTFWRWDSKTGRLARQERLSSGFNFDKVEFERKPLISWLMAPFVNTLTVYVWLKKKWWQKFKGKNPPVNTMWFDGLGKYAKMVTAGHGNWESLRLIYSQPDEKHFTISWFIDRMGFSNANCQAVRNRLKATREIINQYIFSNSNKKILCLACGSAESIMPSIEPIKANGHLLTLVDNDCEVAEYLENTHSCSKNECIMVAREHISEFLSKRENTEKFDFVEMIGALEYMDDNSATKTIRMCMNALKPQGILVTSNLRRSGETPFVKLIINWEMIYRTKQEIFDIIKGGGFDECELITEPLGIHNIVVARKPRPI